MGNRLKESKGFKLIVYTKNMSVFITIIFLAYVGLQLSSYKGSINNFFIDAPTNTVGFVVSLANMYIWYELKSILEDIKLSKNIEAIRLKFLIMIVAELILLNFVTLILLALSLKKYFMWEKLSMANMFRDIKKECSNTSILSLALTMSVCIILNFTILTAII